MFLSFRKEPADIIACWHSGDSASFLHAKRSDGMEMDLLTACVLGGVSIVGGRGSVPAAILGVLVIGVLTNGMQLVGLNEYWQRLVKGVILLAVIVMDSYRVRKGKAS